MGTLYVVGTPIGNLGDLGLRAADLLRVVPVVVAEDTRVARRLLDSVGASPRVLSFHRHSGEGRLRSIIDLLDDDMDVALVSDAGTPGVNDPGAELVSAAVRAGHDVSPLPGPSSIVSALSVSGFRSDSFVSYGFLPSGGSSRRRLLGEIASESRCVVFFETRHRLRAALADIASAMGDRELVICRELTKLHEEIWRGTASAALRHFEAPRGEFVIVGEPVQGSDADDEDRVSDVRILEVLREIEDGECGKGLSRRDMADMAADRIGVSRRRVYGVLHGSEKLGEQDAQE